MAQPAQSDITTLEATRTRLARLDQALDSFRRDLLSSDPLPPWPALQTSLARIVEQLQNASGSLVSDHDTLSAALAYPLPSFPGIEMFGVVETLFRTKKAALAGAGAGGSGPAPEDWEEESRAAAREAGQRSGGMSAEQLGELWGWADDMNDEIVERLEFDVDVTAAERGEGGRRGERFGLKRKLKIAEEDSDDEESDEEEGGGEDTRMGGMDVRQETGPPKPIRPIEDIMRFMSTGVDRSVGGSTRAPG